MLLRQLQDACLQASLYWRIADLVFHILGKHQKIALGGTNPNKRFLSRLKFRRHNIIPKWV
jgi:hypothetical protein